MNTTTPATPWPHACKKSFLYSKLNRISDREIREEVYKAIMTNREITREEAKRVSVLRKNEVKVVLVAFGELD